MIMDYEKKYKESLEKAKQVALTKEHKSAAEYIFPELKESDDERIRKELIKLMKQMSNTIVENYTTIEISTFIAWLEKQGERIYWKPNEEQMQTLHAQLNEGAVTYPEDKRVLVTLYEDLTKIMTQEEKQDEQNPTDKVEPKFKVGQWVTIKE